MRRILLDTDAGVDDILALLLLLRCSDLAELAGITVVAGNVELPQCISNVRRALGVARRYADGKTAPVTGFPISAGASAPLARSLLQAFEVHGPDGLGGTFEMRDGSGQPLYPELDLPLDPRPACDLILDLAAGQPGTVTLVAIGPLTNPALAFEKDPARFRLLRGIVIMGGAFRHDGNTGPRSEFNIHVDPEAAAIVLGCGVPITMVPLDCSEQVVFSRADLAGEGLVHEFVRHATGWIMDFHAAWEGFDGCFHHDTLAVGVAMDPRFASGQRTRVVVEAQGEYTTGETVASLRPFRPLVEGEPNALVCLTPDAGRFNRFFLDRILPPGA